MSLRFARIAVACLILGSSVSLVSQTKDKPAAKPAAQKDKNPLFDRYQFFSATLNGGVANDHDRKIYRSGKLLRADFEQHYRITDLQTLKMWGITGKKCDVLYRPDAASFPYAAYHDFKAEISPKKEEETKDGHACKIETVSFTKDDYPFPIKMKLWEADDLDGFPIRIEIEDGARKFVSTYTNVSLTTPDPKLFERPASCNQKSFEMKGVTRKPTTQSPKKDEPSPAKPNE